MHDYVRVIQSITLYVSVHLPYAMFQEQLYKLNCRDDPRFDHFLGRVWCLLRRYHVSFIYLFYQNDLKYELMITTGRVFLCCEYLFQPFKNIS